MSDPVHRPDELERLRAALEEETERRLEVQKQLDRAGAEFEEFVSTAAHNLRESLRAVVSFSQLLVETQAGRLDPDAGLFLERIQGGAAGMQSLLAAVVDYSAAGSSGRQPSRTDMEAVLRQALLSLERQISERGAIVTHDILPAVAGDYALLTDVLRHLLQNAIEYCEATPARVHISARLEGGGWVFSVRDNGPGIDPAYQGRVFRVFQRLHGKEHPGHGLGLAFCRKAVERLEGRVWLESAPGAGSTLFFSLPPAE
jgi:two-component system, chemotaxis family, sensor kinase Cph1